MGSLRRRQAAGRGRHARRGEVAPQPHRLHATASGGRAPAGGGWAAAARGRARPPPARPPRARARAPPPRRHGAARRGEAARRGDGGAARRAAGTAGAAARRATDASAAATRELGCMAHRFVPKKRPPYDDRVRISFHAHVAPSTVTPPPPQEVHVARGSSRQLRGWEGPPTAAASTPPFPARSRA